MFIRRRDYDRLIRENADLAARVSRDAQEIAQLRSMADWLAAHVSEIKAERALLFERVLNVQLPVYSVEREEPRREIPTPNVPPELSTETLRNMAARFAPAPADLERGQVYKPAAQAQVPVAEAEAMAAMAIFEDVGDARAAELGLGNGELLTT